MLIQTKVNEHHVAEKQPDQPKNAAHHSGTGGAQPDLSLTPENILQLQKTIGNSAVMQLLQGYAGQRPAPAILPVQRMEPEEEEKDENIVGPVAPSSESTKPESVEREDEEEAMQMKREHSAVQRQESDEEDEIQMKRAHSVVQLRESGEVHTPKNNTGLPGQLQSGLETLSGMDLSDVRVQYNSDKPAQVGALGYTQGTDIYIAPGQEKHLPHEGWHVVQQKQGRVQPTGQVAGLPLNDEPGLEQEADAMGMKALNQQPMNDD